MPAQSPTLSPTLSAMVAGLRGSSSGMPASTLPTRSPPTSAPLVKMPPPRRAKIEISEAPKPSATRESIDLTRSAVVDNEPIGPIRIQVVDRHAKQREAGHQHAGDRARLEGDIETSCQAVGCGLRRADIGAYRYMHSDEASGAGQALRQSGSRSRHSPTEATRPTGRPRHRRSRSSCIGGRDRPAHPRGWQPAISCMRALPWSDARTDCVAQMA